MASLSLSFDLTSSDNEEHLGMGPGLRREADRGHDGSTGCAATVPRAPEEQSAAEKSAAQREANEFSTIAESSVGALSEIYAALAVQAAQGSRWFAHHRSGDAGESRSLSGSAVGGGNNPSY